MRALAAIVVSIIFVPIGLYCALLAGLTLIQQTLAVIIDLGNASWTSWMSPPVLLGIQSPGGSGGIFDAMVGGPGSPGGTVGRFIVFGIAALIAYGCLMAVLAVWGWAQKPEGGTA